tara:strand:+ start:12206 stop:12412 length:207 start_codon:yes stop_codon:yes gene_type:complete
MKFQLSGLFMMIAVSVAGCGSSDIDAQAVQSLSPPVPLGQDISSLSPAETAMMVSMSPGGEADPNLGQ